MPDSTRDYLAAIGKRGGIRSRRTLSVGQAPDMVAVREARRAAKWFALSAFATAAPALPGIEIVGAGLEHLAAGHETEEALLVSMAAPRLRLLGIWVPRTVVHPEARLYDRLYAFHGDGAHSRYNALVRRLVSFARAARSCATPRAMWIRSCAQSMTRCCGRFQPPEEQLSINVEFATPHQGIPVPSGWEPSSPPFRVCSRAVSARQG